MFLFGIQECCFEKLPSSLKIIIKKSPHWQGPGVGGGGGIRIYMCFLKKQKNNSRMPALSRHTQKYLTAKILPLHLNIRVEQLTSLTTGLDQVFKNLHRNNAMYSTLLHNCEHLFYYAFGFIKQSFMWPVWTSNLLYSLRWL